MTVVNKTLIKLRDACGLFQTFRDDRTDSNTVFKMEEIQAYVLNRGQLQEHNAQCPGRYTRFQVTGMIEGLFGVGKFGKYFLGALI